MSTLGSFIDKNLISIKDITNYMLWNVVNAFMHCFEPLFEINLMPSIVILLT